MANHEEFVRGRFTHIGHWFQHDLVLCFSQLTGFNSTSAAMGSTTDGQAITRLAEEKIRVKTTALGLRVTEFFHDFDRLRSGYVTASQFKR